MKILIYLIGCILFFTSCGSKIPNRTLVKNNVFVQTVTTLPLTYKKKEIIFIGMHHIGNQIFYNNVNKLTDSLQKQGYIIYYEGILAKDMRNKVVNNINARKLKKITNSTMSPFGIIDTTRSQLIKIASITTNGLVNQPHPLLLIKDTANSKIVDITLDDLIKTYEIRFGTIAIDFRDNALPLENPYPQKFYYPKKNILYVLNTYRNQYLAKQIAASSNNKLAIVYGALHYNNLQQALLQIK